VPSASRVRQLLDAMDRALELGLQTGGTFWGALRENPPDPDKPGDPPPGEGQAFEADTFDEFCERAEKLNGLEEIQVNLGRPGREPLVDLGVRTERIEVRGYKRLRMVGLAGFEDARQVCPSCEEGHILESSPPAHPDPRYYCTVCGGLTPLPETRLSLGGTPSSSVPIAFPCYRFGLHFHAAADPDEQAGSAGPTEEVPRIAVIPSHRFPDVELLEAAVGCGLRAMLVRV
jgi:ribosomal protein S27AE